MVKNQKKETILGLRVKKQFGFQTIEKLKEMNIFDDSFEIKKEDDFLWLPVTEEIEGAIRKEFHKKPPFPNLRQVFGIRAFDIIGEIIIIYLSESLITKEKEIGKYLLENYSNIRAVYRKSGFREKTTRTQNLKLIAGEGSETTHYENGLKFKLDIKKVFFSPRQTAEREELISCVKKNDNVCVCFSGIGPIPIYISTYSDAKIIVAIELNEEAHNFALENIKMNRCKNIELIQGNIREIVPELRKKKLFDLVIMPLPKLSENYINLAKDILKTNGKLILFKVADNKIIGETINELENENFILLRTRKGTNLSPNEYRYMLVAKKEE